MKFDWTNFGEPLIVNLIAGLIISAVFGYGIYCYQMSRYKKKLFDKFDGIEFDIYLKEFPATLDRKATCWVNKNIISYKGEQIDNKPNQGTFQGEFIIDPLNLRFGSGFHYHLRYDGFNFPKIIIKDENTFFVETVYISKETGNFQQYPQAYIWRRKGTKLIDLTKTKS